MLSKNVLSHKIVGAFYVRIIKNVLWQKIMNLFAQKNCLTVDRNTKPSCSLGNYNRIKTTFVLKKQTYGDVL